MAWPRWRVASARRLDATRSSRAARSGMLAFFACASICLAKIGTCPTRATTTPRSGDGAGVHSFSAICPGEEQFASVNATRNGVRQRTERMVAESKILRGRQAWISDLFTASVASSMMSTAAPHFVVAKWGVASSMMSTAAPHFVVAIDGPAGAGKSTVARALANRLGYTFLDTGALYRTV